jgi:SAM-dependent methyltransferase
VSADEAHQHKRRIASGFSAAAATYDTVVPYFATFAEHLVDVAKPTASDHALDVACGRGAVLRELLRRCAFVNRPVGVDLAPGMVEQLRSDGVDADLHVMDVEQLGFDDDEFDLVTCGFGVFFFPDPRAALMEIRRVLAPTGRFVASLFTAGTGTYRWHQYVLDELGLPARRPSPMARPAGLVDLLGDVGFDHIEVALQVQEQFVFCDVDEFIAWQSSHGVRMLLEALDNTGRDRYRELCEDRLRAHRVDAGYEMTIDVTVVAATAAHA